MIFQSNVQGNKLDVVYSETKEAMTASHYGHAKDTSSKHKTDLTTSTFLRYFYQDFLKKVASFKLIEADARG